MVRTDDHATLVVLQSAGNNLRSRSAQTARQNNQWTWIINFRFLISHLIHNFIRSLSFNYVSSFEEQSCDLYGILKRTAAVVGKIKNKTVGFLFARLFQNLFQIVSARSSTTAIGRVERWKFNDT